MTTCDWVGAHGTALAALPEGDPDHGRAFAHARTCPACAARLAEGRRVLALLDADVPEPSAALLRRTSQAVLAAPELGGARTPSPWRLRVALLPAVALGWGLLLVLARSRRPDPEVWLESSGVLGLALLLAVVAVRRAALALGLALAVSAALAAHEAGPGGLAVALGLKCAALEVVASLPALLVALVFLARGRVPRSPALASATAALGALAGQAALHLTCPEHAAGPHLLAFHLGGVGLAALVGSFAARGREGHWIQDQG